MNRPMLAVAALALLAGSAAVAQPATAPRNQPADKPAQKDEARPFDLMVGDKAPAMNVAKWVKGEPVTGFERGKVYVVEFWATWCGPCIGAMPHLTELQKEYAEQGVTIIGLTSRDPGNTLEAVEKMVADKGETIGYTIAWDTERKTNEAYMRASGQGGIPCSFLVDREGRIAFIGHPMSLDKPLEEVVKGTFDMEKAKAAYAEERALEAKLQPLQRQFMMAMRGREIAKALEVLDEMEKVAPKMAATLDMQRFGLLMESGQTQKAYAVGRRLVEGEGKDNYNLLNAIAWTIVDPDGDVADKDLDLAMRAANRAAELTRERNAAILDTLAVVHFLKGNIDRAIDIQTKAVHLAEGDDELHEELSERLEEFKAAKKGG